MNKRPLCLIFLCIAAGIWLIDLLGGLVLSGSPKDRLLQEAIQNERSCRISGKVYRKENKTKVSYLYLKNTYLNVQSEQIYSKKVILKIEDAQLVEIGNSLTAEGTLEAIPEPGNPGQFDSKAYYRGMNIGFFVVCRSITFCDDKEDLIRSGLSRVRERFHQKLEQLVPEDAGILSAMLLGEKSLLAEEQKDRYQMSGISHILAISGLHLSLLGMGLYRLLLLLGTNSKLAGGAAVALLAFYTILTGESVSALRALLMFGLFIGSRMAGRTYDMMSALALSGILILIEYPGYLYYSGFLLSFGAVAALGGVLPCLQKEDEHKQHEKKQPGNKMLRNIKRKLGGGLLSGAVIWLTTLPLVLYFFYEVSVYGLIVNLLVIPTVGIILLSGIVGGMLGFICMTAGKAALIPASALLNLYDQIGSGVQQLPFPTLILGKPEMWQIVLYYAVGIAGLLIWKRVRKPRLPVCLMMCIGLGLMIAVLTLRIHQGLSITALDVGQGDALVLCTESKRTYLIDGGSSSVKQVGRYRIIPYLKSQGIRELEAVLVTHPDEDHVNGVVELLEAVADGGTSLRVKRCMLPVWMAEIADESGIREAAQNADVSIHYLQAGDSITDGKTNFQILHPADGEYGENFNAGSLTFLLEYGGFTGLFTGDLCDEGEAAVQEQAAVCDFLKVAHHGSRNSTGEAFLDRIKPRISVISCARNNRYGHPHPDLLERLKQAGSEFYMTMDGGAVTVWTDGKKMVRTRQFNRSG